MAQDAPLFGKFKLKGKGEKHKLKAAKQQITMEPSNLMNGEDGRSTVVLFLHASFAFPSRVAHAALSMLFPL